MNVTSGSEKVPDDATIYTIVGEILGGKLAKNTETGEDELVVFLGLETHWEIDRPDIPHAQPYIPVRIGTGLDSDMFYPQVQNDYRLNSEARSRRPQWTVRQVWENMDRLVGLNMQAIVFVNPIDIMPDEYKEEVLRQADFAREFHRYLWRIANTKSYYTEEKHESLNSIPDSIDSSRTLMVNQGVFTPTDVFDSSPGE